METKGCGRCKRLLPIDNFKIKDGKAFYWCLECNRAYMRVKQREYRQNLKQSRPLKWERITLPPAADVLEMIEHSTVKATAKILGCSVTTLIGRLKKAGIYHSFQKPTRLAIDIDVLFSMYYNQGKSFNAIRKEFGCTMWFLQSTFRKMGWKARNSGAKPKRGSETLVITRGY